MEEEQQEEQEWMSKKPNNNHPNSQTNNISHYPGIPHIDKQRIKKNIETYFASYSNIDIHETMLKDTARYKAYADAILGNSSLFKDKTVLDVGAGTLFLSLLAVKAGAAKVYAVEPAGISRYGQAILEANNMQDKVEIINTTLQSWWDNVYGFDMSIVKKEVCNTTHIETVNKDTIMTTVATVATFDLNSIDSFQGASAYMDSNFRVKVIQKEKTPIAIVGWFTVEFPAETPDKRVLLSTGPYDTPTHWKQCVMFLEPEMPHLITSRQSKEQRTALRKESIVKQGRIEGRIKMKKNRRFIRKLTIVVEMEEVQRYFFLT